VEIVGNNVTCKQCVDIAETGIGHTVLENILDKIIFFLSIFGDFKIGLARWQLQ